MPYVLRRVDHAVLYHACVKLWPLVFVALPLLNVIARTTPSGWHTWLGIAITLAVARVACLVYSYVDAPLSSYSESLLTFCPT